MPTNTGNKAEHYSEILAIKRKCRLLGIALTPKKEIVARFMLMESNGFEAEYLWLKIKELKANVSMATVYSSLRWFCKFEIVQITKRRNQSNLYEVII